MSYIYPSSFAAEHCIFSAEKYSAVCLQDCYLCWGRPGSAEALAETWASAIKTPRSAEPTQNFFLEKPETVCLFNKKIQGYMFKPGQFQGKQSKLPRFLFHKDNLSRYHRLQLHASLNSYQDLHPDLILRAPTKLPNILLTGKSLNTLLYPQEIMTYLDRL